MEKILPLEQWVPHHLKLLADKIEAARILHGSQRTLALVKAVETWGWCGEMANRYFLDIARKEQRQELTFETLSHKLSFLNVIAHCHEQFIEGYAGHGQTICRELRTECRCFDPPLDDKPTLQVEDGLRLMAMDLLNAPGAPHTEGKIDASYLFNGGMTPTAALSGLVEALKGRVEDELRKPRGGEGATYTVAKACELTGLGNATLAKYTELAGVARAARGKRNHAFTIDEMKSILRKIVEKTTEDTTRKKCESVLKTMN